jgi:hypothetical protein
MPCYFGDSWRNKAIFTHDRVVSEMAILQQLTVATLAVFKKSKNV